MIVDSENTHMGLLKACAEKGIYTVMAHCGGCASAGERCGNGLEKIYPTTAVRFGRMRHIGEFSHAPDLKFTCGAKVIIATDRGIEIGEQVSLTCFGCDKSISRDQMRSYAEASGGDAYQLRKGRILREATEVDLAEWRHIESTLFDKLQTARRFAAELELPMKVVDCEHLFGGERIVFYFLADERVDFRELVRRLAGEFQTRIEMRQIGARDEARLVADYETCGRECCCKTFLKTLKPISMGMAKLQKATLDPSKVSGRCGRLKCCLRYEHESYESLDRKLPRIGVRVRTNHGTGIIVDRQVLTQLLKIRTDDERLISVVVEDVLETDVPPPSQAEPGEGQRRSASRDRSEGGGQRGRNGRGPADRQARAGAGPNRPRRREMPQASPDANDAPMAGKNERSPDGPEPAEAEGKPESNRNDVSAGEHDEQASRPRGPRRRGRRRRNNGRRGPRPEGGSGPNA